MNYKDFVVASPRRFRSNSTSHREFIKRRLHVQVTVFNLVNLVGSCSDLMNAYLALNQIYKRNFSHWFNLIITMYNDSLHLNEQAR